MTGTPFWRGNDVETQIPVTVIISTKNESSNIEKCISYCNSFDEIIVVDSISKDKTAEIALASGASVIDFHWNGQYPKKRQWIIENVATKYPWILFLDADEELTKEFNLELLEFLNDKKDFFSAGLIGIDYYFMHKRLKHGQLVKKISLIHRDKCNYPVLDDLSAQGMGEIEGHYQPVIQGNTYKFKNTIVHSDNEGLDSWMHRHVRYADWESKVSTDIQLRKSVGELKGRLARIFLYLPARSFFMFFYSYVFKLGFLDGRIGLDYALAKGWYYWLAGAIHREQTYIETLEEYVIEND